MIRKNFHIIWTIFLAILFVATSAIPILGSVAYEESTIQLTFDLPEFDFGGMNVDEVDFAIIELQGEGFTNIVGEARLPVVRYMVEIPQSATPEIIVNSVSWKSTSLKELDLPIQILPVQPSIPKIQGTIEEFVIDGVYYSNDAFTHDDIAKVVQVGEIRGRRFALIEVFPVQYNPSSGELKLMTTCEINIDLPGSDMTKTYNNIERYSSPAFEKLFSTAFVNYGSYEQEVLNFPGDLEGYLIIVDDDFYDEILPLATWKGSKGFDATVTKTSEIPGGATKENIKNYIETAYNDWPIPPTYVLLVGDTGQIPTYTGQASETAADLYYVTINPGDYFPDIFIGRFPAAQESHVSAMVEKTIYYEQGYFSSNDFIKKAAFMASTDNYWISEGTHNYVIDTYLDPNGYTCDKLYTYTYGATTQQVSDAINDGRSLAVFSGHGGTDCWWDGPYFDQSHVSALTNEGMYPFVCSHACVTGKFTVSECFGETWLREENKAGLAFWGSSANTLWDEDDILEKKMFSAWWDDGLEAIGGMTDMGLYYLYVYYGGGGYSRYYFECYNVLGDPSVEIWSEDPSDNQPPETPNQPEGITEGEIGIDYTYTTNAVTDPEGDDVQYLFDWDDGTDSGWIDIPSASHNWTERRTYEVRVKARDNHTAESTWSEPLPVTIVGPKLIIESITGGTGVNVVVHNIGDGNATHVVFTIGVDGGLFIQLPLMHYEIPHLSPGQSGEMEMKVFGIGLGIFTEMPTIQITVVCEKGSSDQNSVEAKIILTKVALQE